MSIQTLLDITKILNFIVLRIFLLILKDIFDFIKFNSNQNQ